MSHHAATRAIIDGKLDLAQSLLETRLCTDAEDSNAYILLARVAEARRDVVTEIAMLQQAVVLQGDESEAAAFLGRALARSNDVVAAIRCADRVSALATVSDLALDAVAGIYAQFGRHAQAVTALERAVHGGSRNPAIHVSLGNNRKFVGDFAGARSALERAIELAPRYFKAHAALTSLGDITPDHNHLPQLLELIADAKDPMARLHLTHAAAKECEALGQTPEAWRLLEFGKQGMRKVLGPNIAPVIAALESTPAAFAKGRANAHLFGCRTAAPIFVVGMPRSGTTVVDRILSNHSAVTSVGETLSFAQQLKHLCQSRSADLLDPELLEMLASGRDLTAAGEAYVAHVSALAPGSERTVDKFHLNFMLVGHILRALPNARILCLVRDPRDTIVSNYRQLFEQSSPFYRYSLDLIDTTDLTIAFRKLANYWAECEPRRFCIVRYEQLVAEPADEAERMLAFCGLEPEPGCEAIEANVASVATASSVQVRKPINGRSVGAWKRYAPYLSAMLERLASHRL